jgi:uncharacterized damage-inducible protein DinB
MTDRRPPSLNADEKTTLKVFLDYLRESLAEKLTGLTDEQVRTAGVESGTSLGWLVKHLTAVEQNWFVWSYLGQDPRADHRAATVTETGAELVEAYRAAVRQANQVIDACQDLDLPGRRTLFKADPPSLRWILVHMIEETARHAGHADILREQLDGAIGR